MRGRAQRLCLLVGPRPLFLGRRPKDLERLVVGPGRTDGRQRLGDEHVPVARRAQQVDEAARFPLQPGGVALRENRLEDHEGRAHPPQGDAKLVHAFGIGAGQHRVVVRRTLIRTDAKNLRKRLVHRDARSEREGRRLVAVIALPAGEDVAALRLARRLYSERRGGLHRHGEIVERARRPLDELEFQLGDGLAPVPRPDLAAVESQFDQGLAAIRRRDLHHCGAAHHVGGKCRRQLRRAERPHRIADRLVRGHREARLRRLDRAGPLVAPEHGTAAGRAIRLQGLDQTFPVVADAQREAAPAQAEIARVIVGATQPPRRSAIACGHRRAPAAIKGRSIAAERQLDLESALALFGGWLRLADCLAHRLPSRC